MKFTVASYLSDCVGVNLDYKLAFLLLADKIQLGEKETASGHRECVNN